MSLLNTAMNSEYALVESHQMIMADSHVVVTMTVQPISTVILDMETVRVEASTATHRMI